MHKVCKFVLLAYLVLLVLSLAVFYMLPTHGEHGLPAVVQAPESWQDVDGIWLDLRGGLYIREEWQFVSPEKRLHLTGPDHYYIVLVERTATDRIEVVEYATNIVLADKIKSLEVNLDGEELVMSNPPYYEIHMVAFSPEFWTKHFRRDYYSFVDPNHAFIQQMLHIKVPADLEITYDEKNAVFQVPDTPRP